MYINKLFLTTLTLTFLVSCDTNLSNESESNSTINAESIDEINSVENEVLLTGGGFEPGWSISILQSSTGKMTYELLLNNGDLDIEGQALIDTTNSVDGIKSFILLGNNSEEYFLEILELDCVEPNNKVSKFSLTLWFNSEVLFGCGNEM